MADLNLQEPSQLAAPAEQVSGMLVPSLILGDWC